MRTWTDAEKHAYDGTPAVRVRVEIADSTDTLRDWTNIDGIGTGLIKSISWGDTLEQPMAAGEASIAWRLSEHDNVSPFVTGGRYEGYLAAWRRIVISLKVFPPGADEADFAWREVFRGRIDDFDLSQNPGKIQFRDAVGAELMDQFITSNTRYGDGAGIKDIEDVITDIFTDFDKVAGGHPLVTPVATTLQVASYNQQKMPLLQAAQNLAVAIGWDIRAKWNDAASAWRLTLYEPDRTGTTPDHVIPAADIKSFGSFSFAVQHVRNVVRVFYGDTTQTDELLGNDLRTSVVRTATTSPTNDLVGTPVAGSSIDKYGWRYMELAEGSTSLVQGTSQAQALADFALSDLADPTLLMGVGLAYLFWPVELNDLYSFEADAIRFGSNSNLAIHGYRHVIDETGHRTELTLQGKPGIGATRWTNREARPGKHAPADDLGPRTPTASVAQTRLGAIITVTLPRDFDHDQILFYEGTTRDFSAGPASLVQSGRQKSYTRTFGPGSPLRVWVRIKARDVHGNYSAITAPIAVAPARLDMGLLEAKQSEKISTFLTTAVTLSAFGPLLPQRVRSGTSDAYSSNSGKYTAPVGGLYRLSAQGKLETVMEEGADFTLSLVRDPDGVAEVLGHAVVAAQPSGTQVYTYDGIVPLDEGDELQWRVRSAGGLFASIAFAANYCSANYELVSVRESRTAPLVEDLTAPPVWYDRSDLRQWTGPGAYAYRDAHRIAPTPAGLVFTSPVSAIQSAGNPAVLLQPDGTRVDMLSPSSAATFFGATGASYHPLRLDGGGDNNREAVGRLVVSWTDQAGTFNGVSLHDLSGEWVEDGPNHAAQLGIGYVASAGSYTSIWLNGVKACPDPAYVGELPPISPARFAVTGGATAVVGRIVSSDFSTTTIGPFSEEVAAECHDVGFINPAAPSSAGIVVGLFGGSVDELRGYAIETLTTARGSVSLASIDSYARIAHARDYTRVYVTGGAADPTLYCVGQIGADIALLWSVDAGDASPLPDVTGIVGLAVDDRSGDVYVLAYYSTLGLYDVLVYEEGGALRYSLRADFDLRLDDDAAWAGTPSRHPVLGIDAAGVVYVTGATSTNDDYVRLRPYDVIPSRPPSIPAARVVDDFDAARIRLATSGAAVASIPGSRRALIAGQATEASRPTWVPAREPATLGVTARTLLGRGAVELAAGRELDIPSVNLTAGGSVILVAEPSTATSMKLAALESGGLEYLSVSAGNGFASAAINESATLVSLGVTAPRSGSLAVGVRMIDGSPSLSVNSARPQVTSTDANATPDFSGTLSLGSADASAWAYRLIIYDASFTASQMVSAMHWARHYYETPRFGAGLSGAGGFAITGGDAEIVDGAAAAGAPQFSGITSYNWSAKDLAGSPDGTQFTAWTDRHSAVDLTGSATAARTKETVLGEPVVRFTGGAAAQILTAAAATAGRPCTIFAVVKYDAGAGQGAILDGTTASTRNVPYAVGGSNMGFFAGSNVGTGLDPRGAFYRWQFDATSTTSVSIYRNNVLVATGNPGTQVLSAGIKVGGFYTGASLLDGDLCELVIYDGDLSDTQRGDVETWLASEWAAVL